MGDGKSKRCLMLVELELDTCQDQHPCSSTGDAMVIDKPAKPVAGPSKHPDNANIMDGELIY